MTREPRTLIEQAIERTRKNALQQLGLGALWVVAVVFATGTWLKVVIALTVVNVLIAIILARRLHRLRRRGPAVRALLDEPSQVAEIASWPRKVPPNRMPVFIDIHTKSGDQCSLLLDPKQPQAIADLLGALHSRSPDALLSIPKLDVSGN